MMDDTEGLDDEPIHVGRCKPGESVSVSVAHALAALRDDDASSVDLHEYVDTDALDRLFEPLHDGTPRGGRISFRAADYDVTVRGDGTYVITVTEK